MTNHETDPNKPERIEPNPHVDRFNAERLKRQEAILPIFLESHGIVGISTQIEALKKENAELKNELTKLALEKVKLKRVREALEEMTSEQVLAPAEEKRKKAKEALTILEGMDIWPSVPCS